MLYAVARAHTHTRTDRRGKKGGSVCVGVGVGGGSWGKQPSSHSRAFAIPEGKKKAENLKGSEGGMGDRERVGIEGSRGGQTYPAVALTIIRQKTGKALLPSITDTAAPRKEHASC